MSYRRFAEVYDQLMQDVPYESWVHYTEHFFQQLDTPVEHILDLGTGTGEIAIRLSQRGYQVTGVDLSEEMLTLAQHKAQQANAPVQWLHMDITDMALTRSYDAVISYCDVLNYIHEEQALKQFFANAYQLLNENGLLLFDVHSIGYVDEFLANQTFGHVGDEVTYIWFCEEQEKPYSVQHDLTFFVKNGNQYDRFEEIHVQQTHPVEEYIKWLEEAGLELIQISADFHTNPGYDEQQNDRIFFTAQKRK
ncbi:class I SAM-dependent DNA methyltransferase [Pontibacillus salicampi]|uniref:Class I SAM-dependent DNA methyltransferase n=1 Tax=Pontibacillus salicampi TaxID=1449801 RepID=A0ABV6LJQ6_9BACI